MKVWAKRLTTEDGEAAKGSGVELEAAATCALMARMSVVVELRGERGNRLVCWVQAGAEA